MKLFLPLKFGDLCFVALFLGLLSACAADGISEKKQEEEKCLNYHFRCNVTHTCIPISWRCDGQADCGKQKNINDTSDEEDCPPKTCLSDELMCEKEGESTGQCIPMQWACDGDPDCEHGSDEVQCGRHECIAFDGVTGHGLPSKDFVVYPGGKASS